MSWISDPDFDKIKYQMENTIIVRFDTEPNRTLRTLPGLGLDYSRNIDGKRWIYLFDGPVTHSMTEKFIDIIEGEGVECVEMTSRLDLVADNDYTSDSYDVYSRIRGLWKWTLRSIKRYRGSYTDLFMILQPILTKDFTVNRDHYNILMDASIYRSSLSDYLSRFKHTVEILDTLRGLDIILRGNDEMINFTQDAIIYNDIVSTLYDMRLGPGIRLRNYIAIPDIYEVNSDELIICTNFSIQGYRLYRIVRTSDKPAIIRKYSVIGGITVEDIPIANALDIITTFLVISKDYVDPDTSEIDGKILDSFTDLPQDFSRHTRQMMIDYRKTESEWQGVQKLYHDQPWFVFVRLFYILYHNSEDPTVPKPGCVPEYMMITS